MKRIKRTLALVLALVMVLGLSACGNNEQGGEETGTQYAYRAEYTDIALPENSYVQNLAMSGDKLYLLAEVADGEQEASYTYTDENGEEVVETYMETVYNTGLFTANLDGSEMTRLENFAPTKVPEGKEGNSYVQNMIVDAEGNLWVCEEVYIYSYSDVTGRSAGVKVVGASGIASAGAAMGMAVTVPEPVASGSDLGEFVDEGSTYYLRKLDNTGAELLNINLKELFEVAQNDYMYISGLVIDDAGNVFLAEGNSSQVFVLNSDGTVNFKLGAPTGASYFDNLSVLSDGSVFTLYYPDNGNSMKLCSIDLAAKSWGAEHDAPSSAYNLIRGSGDYDFYYTSSTQLMGYKIEEAVSESVINWINNDVDSNYVSNTIVLPNGDVKALYNDYSSSGSVTQVLDMQKVDASTLPQKTTLTYACLYLDYNIRSQILSFNRSNENYRIEVQDYSQYNTNDDYTAGLTKLTTEITTGKIPDLISTGELPIAQYAAKGLLEDLTPYFESDAEFGPLGGTDVLLPAVLRNLQSNDGKLYQLSPSFGLMTTAALKAVTGDISSWTVDDVLALMETMPEGARLMNLGTTKNTLLQYALYMNMDKYVNWETGEVSFDSQSFIDILKLANTLPLEFDWDSYYEQMEESGFASDYARINLQNRDQLFTLFSFYGLTDYTYELGGDLTVYSFPGIPSADGEGGAIMGFDNGLAMSSTCAAKDGAWQFIRSILTEKYQSENIWNFPVRASVFESALTEIMTPEYYTDENGQQVEVSKLGYYDQVQQQYIDLGHMDQVTADIITGLVDSCNNTMQYDDSLLPIITEEATNYFNGQTTAEQAAQMIQSRASLYVNEQR